MFCFNCLKKLETLDFIDINFSYSRCQICDKYLLYTERAICDIDNTLLQSDHHGGMKCRFCDFAILVKFNSKGYFIRHNNIYFSLKEFKKYIKLKAFW